MNWNNRISRPLVFLLFTLIWMMDAGVAITDDLASGNRPEWLKEIINAMTAIYLLIPLIYLLFHFFDRFPLNTGNWKKRWPVYLVATLVFGLAHTTLMFIVRTPIHWLTGLGNYAQDYGLLQYRVPMEYLKQTLIFWVSFGVYQLLQEWQERQEQEVRAAELEKQLSKARLLALQMQLNPHFLFNTLNMVSSVMYEQPEEADKILANLSDMLRIALALKEQQEHTLADELELLDRYIRIMKTRFKDRLVVEQKISEETRAALIPVFLLQPLIENAIKFSVEATGEARVKMGTVQKNGSLQIWCEDSGPGPGDHFSPAKGNGIGLNNTIQRLEERFRDAYRFQILRNNGQGTRVTLEIPFILA